MEAHRQCLIKLLRYGLLEDLKTLKLIGTINHCCTHFCTAISDAVHGHSVVKAAAQTGAEGTGALYPSACLKAATSEAEAAASGLADLFDTPDFQRSVCRFQDTFGKVRPCCECFIPNHQSRVMLYVPARLCVMARSWWSHCILLFLLG
jgi:hypothetical protein